MFLKRPLVVALFLLLSLSVIVSAADAPKQGGTFRYGITTNPRGMFNPILNTEVYDGLIIDVVYDGLIYIDASLQPQPMIAKAWDISEDGKEITSLPHQGINFHDGVELTAQDGCYT